MRTKKRILVDMDGILANLLEQWLGTYNYENDDDVRMRDVTTWEMHHHVKIGKGIYKIPGRPGFFDNTPPMEGAIDGFKALRRHGHEVIVCSSPYNPDSARAKQEWCARYLGTRWSDVTLTHKKHWMNADVIIDDKPSTIAEFKAMDREVVTIAYPYNLSVAHLCDLRAQNMMRSKDAWGEIVEHLT